ncbi:hypothetical protein DMENIID0001_169200 [Sergentomyia squamirostris]
MNPYGQQPPPAGFNPSGQGYPPPQQGYPGAPPSSYVPPGFGGGQSYPPAYPPTNNMSGYGPQGPIVQQPGAYGGPGMAQPGFHPLGPTSGQAPNFPPGAGGRRQSVCETVGGRFLATDWWVVSVVSFTVLRSIEEVTMTIRQQSNTLGSVVNSQANLNRSRGKLRQLRQVAEYVESKVTGFSVRDVRGALKVIRRVLHLRKAPKKKGYDVLMTDDERRFISHNPSLWNTRKYLF